MLTGLSAFPITPSAPDGRVDLPALRALLAPLLAAEVDSVGLLGSTGSYPYLTRAERRRTLETAVEQAEGRTPSLGGGGALRTDEAVRLAQDARAIGAAVGLLAPVSYTPLLDDEVFAHFVTVAREGGLPLGIYDNPGTTHFGFSPALVGRLSRVPGIVAVKSPAPGADAVAAHLATLREAAAPGFSVGCSVDVHIVEALIAGADAWYSVAAGQFPAVCAAIVRAVRAGDAERARRLNADLEPLWALFREFTSLRVVYALAEIRGICRTVPPRPVLPLAEPARRRVAEVYERLRPVLGE